MGYGRCASAQLNYCNCVVYIISCLMFTFMVIVGFLTDIQNHVNLESQSETVKWNLMVQAASLTFYIVSVYFAF